MCEVFYMLNEAKSFIQTMYKELNYTKNQIQSDTTTYNKKNTRKIKSLSDEQEMLLRKFMEDLGG